MHIHTALLPNSPCYIVVFNSGVHHFQWWNLSIWEQRYLLGLIEQKSCPHRLKINIIESGLADKAPQIQAVISTGGY